MEPKFQTSFIPKKPISSPTSFRSSAKKVDLLSLFALILLLASIALAVSVFLYGLFTEKNIDRKAALLEEAKADFNPDLIAELSKMSRKMVAADELLRSHVSTAQIFKAVADNTLRSIQFTDFTYQYEVDQITVSMKGKAGGFGSIALQSDLFGKSKVLKNPVFTNLNLDSAGNVDFMFTAVIDPASILYKNNVTLN